jgi:hypothetical protein
MTINTMKWFCRLALVTAIFCVPQIIDAQKKPVKKTPSKSKPVAQKKVTSKNAEQDPPFMLKGFAPAIS